MKNLRSAIGLTVVFILVTGIAFPLLITGIALAVFPYQASGSLIHKDGKIVGSELVGQPFAGAGYFHPRPSAAGSGYDANNSGGTNLGPTNPKLLEGAEGFDGIKQLAAAYRSENGLAADAEIPADAVTRSGSGLDPHISPRNAELQTARIAQARGMSQDAVRDIIARHTAQPFLGIFGDPAVNVVTANLALDALRQE